MTRANEEKPNVRVKTYVERDADGWYCVAGFWFGFRGPVGEAGGREPRDPDDALRVGPWPSRQVAKRELRGAFRKAVFGAMNDLRQKHGARLVGAAFNEGSDVEPD